MVGEPVAGERSSVYRQLGAAETTQALAWKEGFEYRQFPVESPSTRSFPALLFVVLRAVF